MKPAGKNKYNTLIAIYDGIIDENEPQTAITQAIHKRKIHHKEHHEHIRVAHKKAIRSKGKVHDHAMLPMVVHPEKFSQNELVELGFCPITFRPSIEGLYQHAGSLNETELQRLIQMNNLPRLYDILSNIN
jgi:hypothetical protein